MVVVVFLRLCIPSDLLIIRSIWQDPISRNNVPLTYIEAYVYQHVFRSIEAWFSLWCVRVCDCLYYALELFVMEFQFVEACLYIPGCFTNAY